MSRKSILYQSSYLYTLGLKLHHRSNFDRRYKHIVSFVKKGDVVLEPACGPAIIADFLDDKSYYHGFDTNETFISCAKKKSLNVKSGNVLDKKNYFMADVVIACDILHHLNPKDRPVFIKNCYTFAKKAYVICEPMGEKKKDKKGLIYTLKKHIAQYMERDGTNDVLIEYYFDSDELMGNIKEGFGLIPLSIKRTTQKIGEDLIAVFYKKAY